MALAHVKKRISLAIKARRARSELGVRGAAGECGLDASTMSRLERGLYLTLPDTATLSKLAAWLEISVDSLLGEGPTSPSQSSDENSIPEIVEVHLRADKNLTAKTAEALSEMFKALYDQAKIKPGRNDG